MSKNKRSSSHIKPKASSPSRLFKKARFSSHATVCDDSTCTSCDVSEIEVIFTTEDGQEEIEPSPDKLLQLALEESSKEPPKEHGGGIAKRLFDMALEKFDKLILKEEQGVEESIGVIIKDKEKERKATRQKVATKQTRYQYASCCIAFGIYMPLVEQIRKGVEILKQIVIEDDEYFDAWIGLGRAQISLARIEREMSQGERIDLSDSEEEQESSIKIEQDSYNLAINTLDKGLSILRTKNENKYVTELILVAKDLQEYVLSIIQSKSSDYIQKILTQAINYLQAAYELNNRNLTENNFAQGIWGCCLYYLVKLKTDKNNDCNENEPKLLLFNAIEKLSKAYNDPLEKDRFTEILGQAYILKTTVESDEEQILNAYEKGLKCLKEAFKLNQDNEVLREQLETLGVFNSENEESEEEDD